MSTSAKLQEEIRRLRTLRDISMQQAVAKEAELKRLLETGEP